MSLVCQPKLSHQLNSYSKGTDTSLTPPHLSPSNSRVWDPMQVLRFEDQPTACLPVTFAPWDPQLLIFAEELSRVYITGRASFHEAVSAPCRCKLCM